MYINVMLHTVCIACTHIKYTYIICICTHISTGFSVNVTGAYINLQHPMKIYTYIYVYSYASTNVCTYICIHMYEWSRYTTLNIQNILFKIHVIIITLYFKYKSMHFWEYNICMCYYKLLVSWPAAQHVFGSLLRSLPRSVAWRWATP